MPHELRLDSAGLAVLLHKILEAWWIRQGVAQDDGPDVPFIEEWLDGQGIVVDRKP